GWESREGKEWIFSFEQFSEARSVMNTALVDEGGQGERGQVLVRFEQKRRQVFYPGDLHSVQVVTEREVVGGWHEHTGRLRVYAQDNPRQTVSIDGYTLESVLPVYSVKALDEADPAQIPQDILLRYTQLPDS